VDRPFGSHAPLAPWHAAHADPMVAVCPATGSVWQALHCGLRVPGCEDPRIGAELEGAVGTTGAGDVGVVARPPHMAAALASTTTAEHNQRFTVSFTRRARSRSSGIPGVVAREDRDE